MNTKYEARTGGPSPRSTVTGENEIGLVLCQCPPVYIKKLGENIKDSGKLPCPSLSEGKTLRFNRVGLVPMPTMITILGAQRCRLWKTRLSMAEREYDSGGHWDRHATQ